MNDNNDNNTTAMPVCEECGVKRTESDVDYSPFQVVLGTELGWYSGDDGEICGPCMTKVLRP